MRTIVHFPADADDTGVRLRGEGIHDVARMRDDAVEFGPVGSGHHGPEEWVSVASLGAYRRTLCEFARTAPVDRAERRVVR